VAKFWEELIIYFLYYETDRIENDASNNTQKSKIIILLTLCELIAEGMCLHNCCLATIGETLIQTQRGGGDLQSTPLRWAQVPWFIKTASDIQKVISVVHIEIHRRKSDLKNYLLK
jgi:hypothetical protein